jgi:hypothetical protein
VPFIFIIFFIGYVHFIYAETRCMLLYLDGLMRTFKFNRRRSLSETNVSFIKDAESAHESLGAISSGTGYK